MHDSEQEHSGITGCRVTYESTIFYNEANKFSIIVVKTNDPRIPLQACSGRYYGDRMLRFTAVGYELPRTKAVELELDGEWVESKYGYQLQVEQWQEIVPQTADGLLAYLGSGLIKGIGPKTAEDIVATFGPDTLNILDNEPEKLLQIRGITEGKLKDIEESYAESRVLRNLMSLLGPFKITPATALKIYQNFGPACVDILKKCPYDLCQISGFGFKRVDGIVRKTDNRLHSAERIKGAVLYTLEDARSKSGHLFLPSEDLVKETLLLLNAPIPIPEQRVRAEEVQETLQQMILHGAVVAYKQYLYSPRVFGQEDDTARMIAERLANISVAENIESALESVRESLGITLSQKQEQAVRTAFQHGLTIITGSPGTGKTTVLKAIIEVFKNLHQKGKFALMAPTGRASRRMAESTGVDEARTLHSALGLGTGEEVGDGERVRFVDADLVIVDEFSMVDMWLAQQFFKRIGQHTRVVLVGDPNQLPSVGAGNVFYELIHSGMVPVTVLDWIFRQSKDGLIAYNAKFINEGSTKLYYGNDFVFVDSPTQIETARRIQDIYCKEAAERGIENVQILSPFREKGEAASEQLNRAIRERVNPFRSAEEEVKIGSRTCRVHDRVMQTKNTEKVSKDDFATLERDAAGNVKWRDSMLENLVDESFYKFRESCVFYKGTDGVTISDFIHQSASGITILEALQVYQYGIRNKQAKKRRCKRDMGIVEKMKKVPATPSNLARWIDRNVMPHYLFYSYDRNQPETQVFCTYCEKFSVIKKPKTGKIFVCPQCKQKAIAKAQGRRAAYHEDRGTCQVIQKISDEELLIRIFKVRWAYKGKKNTPAKEIYENARLFIRVVGKEGTDTEAFYYDSSYDSTTHWRRGNRPRFSPYTSGYEADDTGAIYLPSLKRALQGTPWQYCALRQFYEPTKEAMQVSTYLRVYRRHPKLIEHLVKVGFERIVSDIVYRHGMGAEIDATQKRTHRILRVNKEDLTSRTCGHLSVEKIPNLTASLRRTATTIPTISMDTRLHLC